MSQELENIDVIEEDPTTEESEDLNLLTIRGNVISEYLDSLFQQKMKSIVDDIKNQINVSQKETNEEKESLKKHLEDQLKGELNKIMDEKLKEDRKRIDNIIATINKLAVAIRKQNEFLLKLRTENNKKITEMENLINSSLDQKVCVIPSSSENIVLDKKQVVKPKKK